MAKKIIDTEIQAYYDGKLKAWITTSDEQVLADAKEYADYTVSTHNTSSTAHNDIRLLIKGLTTRLDVLADSDDETLDQLSEIVTYIKSNKSLIESITTSKVSVADIIDNLTTSVSNKPLSAKQGVVLKGLIDAIVVPTKVSELENDAGYLTQHQDLSDYAKITDIPVTVVNGVITFSNGLTITCDETTGEVTFVC